MQPQKSILVAIGNLSDRSVYSSRVADEGFNVATVSDAISCLHALRCGSFDLVVIESQLPWGHGDGVVDVMKSDPEISTIPAIIIDISRDAVTEVMGSAASASRARAIEELVHLVRAQFKHSA